MFISRARRLRGLSTTSFYHARFASVTAAMVKELQRDIWSTYDGLQKGTYGVGGEIEMAMDWLRAKGIAKASKSASRRPRRV